ncbi:hypothetical protein [Pseudoalteromonas sp. T1lg10]|uniref:hypothetical protein n=1 Tax=Pseudoalteromonas sp. T1lg10 TaxID=2077093 RepID=UPI000CF71AEA|nr:hypothetical protein [Pseudoalteromonas sp. T1lg10]
MSQITVTNQEEFKQALKDHAFATIILDGDEFKIPKKALLAGFKFIGKSKSTTLYLRGELEYSFSKSHSDLDDSQYVNQFRPFGAIESVHNLMISCKQPLQLTFQDRDELNNWENVKFDNSQIDIVFIDETMDDLLSQNSDTSPAERFVNKFLSELM